MWSSGLATTIFVTALRTEWISGDAVANRFLGPAVEKDLARDKGPAEDNVPARGSGLQVDGQAPGRGLRAGDQAPGRGLRAGGQAQGNGLRAAEAAATPLAMSGPAE